MKEPKQSFVWSQTNLNCVTKHGKNWENYSSRKNCLKDWKRNFQKTDIFDSPALLLTYFVFAQQKILQKFSDPEMGNLIIETHHDADTFFKDAMILKISSYLVH